ncbi:winged helix-turn-helix transcriptional regulator [Clostridium sp. 'White wine YQ']|uniref:winged helix-turn-helix transcriptional regulator n=1 Tax=Clostridium sp. 'White wine YQ' TaxID=3027474 RepID=UPI00236544BA|nr:helix-turn-helix domain-containing protein [Clostridium sp. 'White wine YQ']MDD7792832.1 helix-turn-helix domain-containing protein [Clostridium sp. 'White wine YQ']
MREEFENNDKTICCVEKALNVLDGKWSFLVIKNLFDGTKRFGELRKSLHNISPKTLTLRLRELEQCGVVQRKVYPTIPPAVEYSLTEKGQDLRNIIDEMNIWGKKWC